MNSEPFGTTVFCDDIRHEINNKLTLIGCYAGELKFSGPPPGILPTFAALINIRIPKAVIFKTVKLRVIKEEGDTATTLLETEIEPEEDTLDGTNKPPEQEANDRILSLTFPCRWSPLQFSQDGLIKVRAYLDGEEEIRLGALLIEFDQTTQEAI